MIITLEGIDGLGKSTLAQSIKNYLAHEYYSSTILSFPLHGYIKHAIQFMKDNEWNIDPRQLALLFGFDMATGQTKIANAIMQFDVVLLDRYYYSTYAYEGALISENPQQIFSFCLTMQDFFSQYIVYKPDCTLVLHSDAYENFHKQQSTWAPDFFEAQDGLLLRAQCIYTKILPNIFPEIKLINVTNRSQEEVLSTCIEVLDSEFNLRRDV